MTPDEISMLLSLTRRASHKGDELISATQKAYSEHVREVMELRAMWREAGERLDREEQRFAHYFPKDERRELPSRDLPRIVQKGPKTAEGS